MLVTVFSGTQQGGTASAVSVNVYRMAGHPGFTILGMPPLDALSCKRRVLDALTASKFTLPRSRCRITVDLQPAQPAKDDGRFDLAIAVGIWALCEQIPRDALRGCWFFGRLQSNGMLAGVSDLRLNLREARERGHRVVLPRANAPQGTAEPGVTPAADLHEVRAQCCSRTRYRLRIALTASAIAAETAMAN